MKTIKLTQNRMILVDDEDYEWLNKYHWYLHKTGNMEYARRDKWKNGERTRIYMHREIMGFPEGYTIDHKDRNGLNNQKRNLRICSFKQNLKNSKWKSLSGLKGVYPVRSIHKTAKWYSRVCDVISNKRKYVYLKASNDKYECAIYSDIAMKIMHGEYAMLNFPDRDVKKDVEIYNYVKNKLERWL